MQETCDLGSVNILFIVAAIYNKNENWEIYSEVSDLKRDVF